MSSSRKRQTSILRTCKHCGGSFHKQGFANHESACVKELDQARRSESEAQVRLIEAEIQRDASLQRGEVPISRSYRPGSSTAARPIQAPTWGDDVEPASIPASYSLSPILESVNDSVTHDSEIDVSSNMTPASSEPGPSSTSNASSTPSQPPASIGGIKIEYHPHSRRAAKTYSPREYWSSPQASNDPPDSEPWEPFRSKLDFELAELMLDTRMNRKQSARLIALIHSCVEDPDSFTLEDDKDLDKIWYHARVLKTTGFQRKEFTVPYKGEDRKFEVFTSPLWDWACELLQDPGMIHRFKWDAERHFKFDGYEYKRFITEPVTADKWWDIQLLLPKDGKPLFFIIYADKTRLSSFGTVKAYPVVARIANLPIDIRNSDGVGGGRLIGWLPIVDEDAGETGKKGYVNFKRIVWHRAFYEILDAIKHWGKTGYRIKCADNVIRILFPLILILAADYEEACVMALIRGIGSYAPCPVCLVPNDKLSDLMDAFPLRTKESMMEEFTKAQEMNRTEGDEVLKTVGLRDVENVFWDMSHCDPYQALSWDRLHAYHGGLFSDHIWTEFKRIAIALGKPAMKQIDNQVDTIPRWQGLNHFPSGVLKHDFADGSKYEDIAKVVMFASHNVFTKDMTPEGFALLQLLRSYLELDMYASLTVQTEETLEGFKRELAKFDALLQEYSNLWPTKSWNFPKAHTHVHIIKDILEKGVTRVFNNKPNEKAHSPLKDFYQLMTNFKEFAIQVLRLNENDIAATVIRDGLDRMTQYAEACEAKAEDGLDVQDPSDGSIEHIRLRSRQPDMTFGLLEHEMSNDAAFVDFRKRLSKALGIRSRARGQFTLAATDEITPFRLLAVDYESLIDWKIKTDLIRANPSFHGRPRYDCVLVRAELNPESFFFARLLYAFEVFSQGSTHRMALILPLDEPIRRSERVPSDVPYRFTRVRSRRRSAAAFVDIHCIIRGAVLVPSNDDDAQDEFLVFDVMDEDFWWRMKSVTLANSVRLR